MSQLTPQKRFRAPKSTAVSPPKRGIGAPKGFGQMQKMMGRGTGQPRKFATPKLK